MPRDSSMPAKKAYTEEQLEAAIIAAYERGAEWTRENPNSPEYVKKAARDYADKITSPMNN